MRLCAERVERSVRFRVGALLERVQSDGEGAAARTRRGSWDAAKPLRWSWRIGSARGCTRPSFTSMASPRYGPPRLTRSPPGGVCARTRTHHARVLSPARPSPRYVSGHLLGHGVTHPCVEVVTPDADQAAAMPFDPCNGAWASARYLTGPPGRITPRRSLSGFGRRGFAGPPSLGTDCFLRLRRAGATPGLALSSCEC